MEIGQEVAYNLSGEIAKGRIKSLFSEPINQWHDLEKIEVELLHDVGCYPIGHISKIKSQKNVLVLLNREI